MKKALFVAMVLGLMVCLVLPMGAVTASPGTPPTYPPQYYLAAHAVVVNLVDADWEETAWADCNNSQNFPGGNWAWYFSYPGNPGGGAPGDDNAWGLYAGQTTGIGWVRVAVSGNDMAITFEVVGNYRLAYTSIAVVPASAGWQAIPQTNSGNPKVGHFAGLDGEKSGMAFDPPVQTYTYHYTISP